MVRIHFCSSAKPRLDALKCEQVYTTAFPQEVVERICSYVIAAENEFFDLFAVGRTWARANLQRAEEWQANFNLATAVRDEIELEEEQREADRRSGYEYPELYGSDLDSYLLGQSDDFHVAGAEFWDRWVGDD